ncbi:MAG: DUF2442 domain-containing protein [Acidimicrobiia bacterium]|nr:DUF2442 domain-containing protein [Acidimicrobiia bacterium]MYE68240.1 DUF2442 domain-containing protein [Acidimicrobiia bacterium]MYJ14161.1 DUF2442 domain-containing protein [Acidimicrobiia bacterium]
MNDTARRPRPLEVRALDPYRIWLRYDDGAAGEVDLSHLARRQLFAAWSDPDFFASVHIDAAGAIVWNDDLDLCPDALYRRL